MSNIAYGTACKRALTTKPVERSHVLFKDRGRCAFSISFGTGSICWRASYWLRWCSPEMFEMFACLTKVIRARHMTVRGWK